MGNESRDRSPVESIPQQATPSCEGGFGEGKSLVFPVPGKSHFGNVTLASGCYLLSSKHLQQCHWRIADSRRADFVGFPKLSFLYTKIAHVEQFGECRLTLTPFSPIPSRILRLTRPARVCFGAALILAICTVCDARVILFPSDTCWAQAFDRLVMMHSQSSNGCMTHRGHNPK